MAGAIPDYEELKVRIGRATPGTYSVVATAGDRAGHGSFELPFDETRLENFVLRVGQPRSRTRSGAGTDAAMDEARRFGAELFRAIFSGDIYEMYSTAREHAQAQRKGVRITLYLSGVPELLHVPWEFLYDRPRFLAHSIRTPIVRSLDLKSAPAPRKVTLPLRILGMDSRPRGKTPLDADQERENLEHALADLRARGLVELHWLERATLRDLQRTLDAPDEFHVFHFIGHGDYDERREAGVLYLEDAEGNPQDVTGERIASYLCDEDSLRLAVLNACEGARTSQHDPFSGVASALVEGGIPAVLGMQFEITDPAAVTLAQQLYESLAVGYPVDASVAQARRAVSAEGNETEFGTPVLFLRAAAAKLFEVEETEAVSTERQRLEDLQREAPSLSSAGVGPRARNRDRASPLVKGPGAPSAQFVSIEKKPYAVTVTNREVWVAAGEPLPNKVLAIDYDTLEKTGTEIGGKLAFGDLISDGRQLWTIATPNLLRIELCEIDLRMKAVSGQGLKLGRMPILFENWISPAVDETSIWVPLPHLHTVARVNRQAWQVVGSPIAGAVSPSGCCVTRDAVWVTDASPANKVIRIDPHSNAVVGEVDVGLLPGGIVEIEGRLWVSNGGDGTVTVIDPDAMRMVGKPIEVGARPRSMAVGDGLLWVASFDDSSITRIDPENHRKLGGTIPVAAGPDSLTFEDGALWLINTKAKGLTRIAA